MIYLTILICDVVSCMHNSRSSYPKRCSHLILMTSIEYPMLYFCCNYKNVML